MHATALLARARESPKCKGGGWREGGGKRWWSYGTRAGLWPSTPASTNVHGQGCEVLGKHRAGRAARKRQNSVGQGGLGLGLGWGRAVALSPAATVLRAQGALVIQLQVSVVGRSTRRKVYQ